jgi:hypothetical protein
MNRYRCSPVSMEYTVPDPFTTEISTAIASQVAQALTSQASHALSEIGKLIRRRFHGQPTELATLTDAQSEPDSDERISLLAAALQRAAREDHEFGRQILALWAQPLPPATTVTGNTTANVFNGHADKVIQIGTVQDLTIN